MNVRFPASALVKLRSLCSRWTEGPSGVIRRAVDMAYGVEHGGGVQKKTPGVGRADCGAPPIETTLPPSALSSHDDE